MTDVIPLRKDVIIGEAGGPPDELRAWLCLYAEHLVPEVVSQRLGCAPTCAHRKGDRRGDRGRPFEKGAWILTVEARAPASPDGLVRALLGRFPADSAFWAELRRDYDIRITFGVHTSGWNRGFDLSSESMDLLARTGASVGFDLYSYGEDEA
jgi:hypothetical protein